MTETMMTWNEVIMYMINTVFKIIIMCAIPYLFGLARKKIKGDIQEKYLNHFEGIIKDAVTQVQQTYVDNMKAENLFDEKAQLEAFDMVKATVLNTMNEKMMEVVVEAVGDFDEYMRNKIEAAVHNLKANTPIMIDGVVDETNA